MTRIANFLILGLCGILLQEMDRDSFGVGQAEGWWDWLVEILLLFSCCRECSPRVGGVRRRAMKAMKKKKETPGLL